MRDLKLKSKTCKERYEWYKEHGICTTCGVKWAEPGHVRCKDCEKRIAYYHDQSKEARIKRKMEQRAERIAKGLCTECGIRKATPGMRMCPICRERRNDSTRKYRIHKKIIRNNEKERLKLIKEMNQNGNSNNP